MRLVYPLLVSALPLDKRCKIARVISLAFGRAFAAERLLDYNKGVVCQIDGEIVGVACVRESSRYEHPTVECVCVAAQHRRRGIAREVMQCVQSDLGYDALMLHLDADAPHYAAAAALYRSVGFVEQTRDECETAMTWTVQQ